MSQNLLNDFIDQRVAAFWTTDPENGRNGFHTHISVCGILEKKDVGDYYRILNDIGNYAYFTPKDVLEVTFDGEHIFQDGAVAVIHLGVV